VPTFRFKHTVATGEVSGLLRRFAEPTAVAYDAFVSYSHAHDKPVAAALQSAMQRLGKAWYRRRALRLFRDDTSLSATPELWRSIEQALGQSRFLILIASVEAAASPWVDKEVAHWLDHNGLDTLLIALTDGELAWDGATGDFRWSEVTPLPPTLKGRFAAEPFWIDLRPYRDSQPARSEIRRSGGRFRRGTSRHAEGGSAIGRGTAAATRIAAGVVGGRRVDPVPRACRLAVARRRSATGGGADPARSR
jgi:hypothetical protein